MANLFIAMGGSGLKTVREIRDKGREGDYFLFIDTDTNDLQGFSDREVVDLSRINVMSYLQTESDSNPVRKKVEDWLDVSAKASMKNQPLSEGASANRPQGRLAIASIADEFQNRISELVRSILDINKNDTDGLNTFIVLSVAGGTGSSIYLDLTQILYDKLYNLKDQDFNKPTTVFFMPDVFVGFQRNENVDRYKTNVFAFWKELDAIQRDYFGSIDMNLITNSTDLKSANEKAKRSTYFSDFAIKADKFVDKKVPFQAFGSAILIDHENSEGQSTDIKLRYKEVARLLEMISVRTHGGTIKSALDNTILPNAVTSLNNRLPWVKQYWSAGYAEIRGGSELFQEYVIANTRRVIYETFIGVNGASKDNLDEYVKPLFQDNLLAYIEKDGYNGFANKAKEVDGKLLNVHGLIDKYWKENLEANLERQYLDGVETKDDTSADGIKRLFDNDIKDKASAKLMEYLITSGFHLDRVSDNILTEFYEKCTEIALTYGLQKLSFVLEELDTRIDDLSMNYDTENKALANKQSNVIIADQNVPNRNLSDTIIEQYATIKEGPGMFVMNKKQWYETELTNLRNLIKANFTFQADELALKLKKEICDKISFGHSNDMMVRGNVTRVINSLQAVLSSEVAPNAHKHLIDKYLSFKNNALSNVIPDVSRFSETDSFNDLKLNIFKRIFETECGLATGIKDGKPYFVQRSAEKTDPNSKSIEDLLRIIFKDKKFVLNNVQNGSESSSKFIETFENLINENLISNLNSILTRGQSVDNSSTGYPKYASFTLEDWIQVDSEGFNSIKTKFDKRASVFCHLKNASNPQQLWLSPAQLKKRINDIYLAEGNSNIPPYSHVETNEDAIIAIKYIDNLSFDNYFKYDHYKEHYRICLSNNINNYYPHIDVRFKKAMARFLHDVENQTPILNVLSQGSTAPPVIGSQHEQDAINYLKNYSQFYFLAKFYEKLNTEANNAIFKNLVMTDVAFNDRMAGSGRNGMFNPPVYIEGDRIWFFSSPDINRLQDNGIVWMSGNTVNLENFIEVLTLDKLTESFQKVILLNEEKPSEWAKFESQTNFTETNIFCIKRRYATSLDKTIFKSILTSTVQEVKEDMMKLIPFEEDFKVVFNKFYLSFSNDLNKLIN